VTEAPNLRVEDEGGVRILTIDRPQVKNALTQAMRNAFIDIVAEADADPGVHALVVTATDPVFSAGVDFKDRPMPLHPVQLGLRADPAAALRMARTPSICAVNGACVSGGLEIALSCSFVIASERARFADTHARLNVVPGWGLTALLPRAVGLRKAREMSITGNFVDAEEALRIGLVNHVVPHEELRERAVALAREISSQPAVGEVLRLYARGEGLGFSEAVALERDALVNRTADPDAFRSLGEETAKRAKS
jgi:enoyl-CoA hydratase